MGLINKFGAKLKIEFLSKLVDTVSGALMIVFLARFLDTGQYGLLFLAISVFTIAGLFGEFGLAKSAARYLTEYNEKDRTQIRYILSSSLKITIGALTLVSVVIVVGHELLADALGESDLILLLLLAPGYIIFHGLITYLRRVFQGFQQIRVGAQIQAVRGLLKLLFVGIFVVLGYGAVGALIGHILAFAVTVALGFVALYYLVYPEYEKTESPEPGLLRRMLEYSVPISFTKSADKIVKEVDVVLIGLFLNPVAVGYYVISKQVVTFTQLPSATLSYTLSPVYGEKKSAESIKRASELYEETLIYTLMMYVPAALGIIIVADPMVTLVFGTEYAGAVTVLQILSLFVIFQALTRITSGGLDYLGRATDRAKVKSVSAIGNIILNIIFIPQYGVEGAAIATIVTYGFYSFANVYIMHTELTFRFGFLARQIALVLLISGTMAGVVLFAMSSVAGLVSLISVVLLGVAVWAVLCTVTGLLDVSEVRAAFG
ncbi:flippase [Natronobiforma cellulositropha]|uniref:flippase n=1 Tax=Natronobiforma cellulositropha TaxID=1679076 RepID=UPI0021D5A556|nr:flippase [Natronobiforma cellulositropha]